MSEYIEFDPSAGSWHEIDPLKRADLVAVVRCRDCKHFRIEPWDEVLAAQYGAPPMICERTGDMDDVEPDGFCAWGERKVGV